MNKTKILIAGLGGIGGYFGGHLAKSFANDAQVEVYFLARGKNLEAINKKGLTVKTSNEQFTTMPTAAAAHAAEFGVMDYILISVKSYDLDELLTEIKDNIGRTTVIIPLMNGVEGAQKIRTNFPQALVTEGCANIIVRLQQPGIIESFSSFKSLHFGIPNVLGRRLEKIQEIFQRAEIDSALTPEILEQIWFKFIFISAAAATTSFYNASFGKITQDQSAMNTFRNLVEEACNLCAAEGITLRKNAKEKIVTNLLNAPAEATTSMHTDLLSGRGKSEVDTLVGYPARQGKALGLDVPLYTKIYQKLSANI